MRGKIENEQYQSLSEFTEDFKLMCNNAMVYNQPETVYYKAARKLLQTGLKLLAPDKMRSLLPLIPSIRFLSEDVLFGGSPLFRSGEGLIPKEEHGGEDTGNEEDDILADLVCLDPTKSVHYVPPHPNDPP